MVSFRDLLLGLGLAWLAWSLFNVAVVALVARWQTPDGSVYVVGLLRPRVVFPWAVAVKLNALEYAAVCAHEHGHIARGHIWKNFWLVVLLPFYRSTDRAARQELEADAFAFQRGHGIYLASALRKLSTHPFDLKRAELLERAAELKHAGARPAPDAGGMLANHPRGMT